MKTLKTCWNGEKKRKWEEFHRELFHSLKWSDSWIELASIRLQQILRIIMYHNISREEEKKSQNHGSVMSFASFRWCIPMLSFGCEVLLLLFFSHFCKKKLIRPFVFVHSWSILCNRYSCFRLNFSRARVYKNSTSLFSGTFFM